MAIPDQGTNMYALTQMFARGAERFPGMFLEHKRLASTQTRLGDRSFTGSTIGVSALQIFETAVLLADFATEKERLELSVGRYTLHIDQLQDRLRDHAAQDANAVLLLRTDDAATQLVNSSAENATLRQRANGADAQLEQSQSEIARLGDQVASLRSQATGLKSILAGIPWCLRCCCCIPNPDDEDEVRRPLLVQ